METAANAVDAGASAPEPTQETTDSAPVEVEKKVSPEASEPEWFKKRFDEITGRFRSEERRATAAEQRAQQLEQQLRQLQEQPREPEKVKTLSDFEYDEGKYQTYLFEQTEKRAIEAAKRVRQEELAREEAAKRQRTFREREAEYEKEDPEYRQVAYGDYPMSEDLGQVVMDMDDGPALLKHLGKNKELAYMLSQLPVHKAAVQLGRLAAELAAEKASKKAALDAARAAKAVTQAPDPTPRIDGAGDATNIRIDTEEGEQLSDAEWTRRRNKQVARRRSG